MTTSLKVLNGICFRICAVLTVDLIDKYAKSRLAWIELNVMLCFDHVKFFVCFMLVGPVHAALYCVSVTFGMLYIVPKFWHLWYFGACGCASALMGMAYVKFMKQTVITLN